MGDSIIITRWPSDHEYEDMLDDNQDLVCAIAAHRKTLEKKGVKIIEERDNILETEEYTYGAFWDKDLELVA